MEDDESCGHEWKSPHKAGFFLFSLYFQYIKREELDCQLFWGDLAWKRCGISARYLGFRAGLLTNFEVRQGRGWWAVPGFASEAQIGVRGPGRGEKAIRSVVEGLDFS
jgi:hypothetical protein